MLLNSGENTKINFNPTHIRSRVHQEKGAVLPKEKRTKKELALRQYEPYGRLLATTLQMFTFTNLYPGLRGQRTDCSLSPTVTSGGSKSA